MLQIVNRTAQLGAPRERNGLQRDIFKKMKSEDLDLNDDVRKRGCNSERAEYADHFKIVAVASEMIVIAYHVIAEKEPYGRVDDKPRRPRLAR
jgi:hypothetical protein